MTRPAALGAAEARALAEALSVHDAGVLYVDLMKMFALHLQPLVATPLTQLIDVNERMQTLGPLLEPTAYQRGGAQNLHDQRRLLDAARALQRVMWEIGGAS